MILVVGISSVDSGLLAITTFSNTHIGQLVENFPDIRKALVLRNRRENENNK